MASESSVGNGGDGFRIRNKLYLLDFVEWGNERNPYVDINLQLDPNYTRRVSGALVELSDVPVELIARKIQEIAQVDNVLARTLLVTLEFYRWKMVTPELVNVGDEESPIADSKDLVQLAIRNHKVVRINRRRWRELDDLNKAGLIFHELIYALIPPEFMKTREGVEFRKQSSAKVRNMNGYLFTRDLKDRGVTGLTESVYGLLPMMNRRPNVGETWRVKDAKESGVVAITHAVDGRLTTGIPGKSDVKCVPFYPKEQNQVDQNVERFCTVHWKSTGTGLWAISVAEYGLKLKFSTYQKEDGAQQDYVAVYNYQSNEKMKPLDRGEYETQFWYRIYNGMYSAASVDQCKIDTKAEVETYFYGRLFKGYW